MTTTNGQVELTDGASASVILHRLLLNAVQSFPETLAAADIPASSDEFRKRYVDILPRFELARLNSDRRRAIAANLAEGFQQSVCWLSAADSIPLSEHLAQDTASLALPSPRCDTSARLATEYHL